MYQQKMNPEMAKMKGNVETVEEEREQVCWFEHKMNR